MTDNRYRIDAVYQAGQVLEVVADSREPMGPSEIAAALGIKINAAFRQCVTLDEMGWLKEVNKKYVLGDRLALFWARYKTRREADLARIQNELKNLEIHQEGTEIGGEKAA
ncbi:MAG: helix-turn-helix domain-containing protein [Actinomycetota bacterium]|nr:helix-turn-helix domain-containing protein [Actinomycetota bacterium]